MSKGSAARNIGPIIEALSPLISDTLASSSASSTSRPQLLELASYPYEHITAFARRWGDFDWWGTARDDSELKSVDHTFQDDPEGGL